MKVILSRKGFDSQYGGYPSPIITEGRMISLPIPADVGKFENESKYSNLRVEEKLTYLDFVTFQYIFKSFIKIYLYF